MTNDNTREQTNSALSRRTFMRGAGAATVALSALQARGAKALWWQPVSPDYGPLSPTKDLATGLNLLSLPKGFSYRSYGWSGQTMSDGRPTPTMHDGMAVVGRRGRHLSLVRNHENSAGSLIGAIVEGGMYNPNEKGGTTNLSFDLLTGRFRSSYTSLGGTIRNCAGGPTPWASWITCEETFHAWGSRADGFNHGYIFDVPGFEIASGTPVRAAGRFSHEAVAVDPRTGVVYETEDTGGSGFYKYVQPGAGGRGWRRGRAGDELLRDGGELFAMVVTGESRKDLRGGFEPGESFKVEWQRVEDPEGKLGAPFDSAPDAALISRGEGAWYDAGKIYFVSTDGGAAGLGQVWVYDPNDETLTLLFESTAASEVDGPDNLAVSPRGGIILCEDGGSDPKRMVGLTPDGAIFPFAENLLDIGAADVDVIEAAFPGVKANYTRGLTGLYTSQEWAGATFYGDYLFANIQTPGVTFAITGPWRRGAL
jgi:secreted PhoX family phosphatase